MRSPCVVPPGTISLTAFLTTGTCLLSLLTGNPALAIDAKQAISLAPISLIAQNRLSGGAEARETIQQGKKLTLESYLRAVDENFPGLEAAKDVEKMASANRLEKQGVFDPLLSTESGYTRMQNTSRIGGAKRVLFNYPKVEIPFRSGVRTFAQYRYNPNSAQSPYIETGEGGEYSGGLYVPLLRGLIHNEQSFNEKEAKFGEQIATQTFALTRLDTLLRAGTIYWNWVAANQKIKVSTAILELAELVAKISGQQAESGDLAKIYVTEAEEDVERRNADLAQSQRDFQRYSFRLSAMLFDVGGVPLPLPTEQNVPEAMPRPQMMMAEEQDRNVIKALATRPELKAIDLQKKIAQAQLKLAENQLLPAMNAVVVGGYDNGKNGIHKVYRGQVTFSQPLLMRTAKGKVQAAKLRLDKLARDRQAEEQRIRNEVYDAISAINLSYTKFLALEKQVQKSQQVYFGERERFQVGDSTVFLVSERERQLNEAKFRLIDAQVEFQVGLLALKAITTQL